MHPGFPVSHDERRRVGHDAVHQLPCRSVVRVTLVAQVHRLLQRPAGIQLFFTHVDHVLRPKGPLHKRIEAFAAIRSRRSIVSSAAGSPLRVAGSEGLAAAGKGDPPRLHTRENTWTSNHTGWFSRRLRLFTCLLARPGGLSRRGRQHLRWLRRSPWRSHRAPTPGSSSRW